MKPPIALDPDGERVIRQEWDASGLAPYAGWKPGDPLKKGPRRKKNPVKSLLGIDYTFVALPRGPMDDNWAKLSFPAVKVWGALARWTRGERLRAAPITYDFLGEYAGLCRHAVIGAVRELEMLGMVKVTNRGPGRGKIPVYELTTRRKPSVISAVAGKGARDAPFPPQNDPKTA